jgi:hypothetical protein
VGEGGPPLVGALAAGGPALIVAAVADLPDDWVRARAVLVAAMLSEGDRPVSFVDPDARSSSAASKSLTAFSATP